MPRIVKIILVIAILGVFTWTIMSSLKDLNLLPRASAPTDTLLTAESENKALEPAPVDDGISMVSDENVTLDNAEAFVDTQTVSADTLAVDTAAQPIKPVKKTVKQPKKRAAAPEPKGPCEIPAPDFYTKRKPDTRVEAQNLSQWMWRKAVCFRSQNLDSCAYYINAGIGVFENASLFTLRAFIHLERKNYSAAKTAAEISLSRNDHWNSSDKKTAQEYKIAALKGLLAAYPSSITEKELRKAENELILNYGR